MQDPQERNYVWKVWKCKSMDSEAEGIAWEWEWERRLPCFLPYMHVGRVCGPVYS